jgi:protoheme ferro-lyase
VPTDYDAILLVSFGGPEGPDDVLPFMENVTAGKDIPRERLEEVSQHYVAFGGRSPINDQCRALQAALEGLLAEEGPDLPVYWGNRNWHPMLADTLRQMRDDGIESGAVLRHLRVLVVLRVPSVPRGPGPRAGRGRRRRTRARQDPRLLQPRGVRGARRST